MCKRTQINLISPLHGTPLHTACKSGTVKVVQQLLLNNSDLYIRDHKGFTAKEYSNNNRIHTLINKYELRMASGTSETLLTDE